MLALGKEHSYLPLRMPCRINPTLLASPTSKIMYAQTLFKHCILSKQVHGMKTDTAQHRHGLLEKLATYPLQKTARQERGREWEKYHLPNRTN